MDNIFEVSLVLYRRGIGDQAITLKVAANDRMHAVEETERVIRNYIYTDVEIEIIGVKPL
jgi:hypothetical protein